MPNTLQAQQRVQNIRSNPPPYPVPPPPYPGAMNNPTNEQVCFLHFRFYSLKSNVFRL